MICAECCQEATGSAQGWRAYLLEHVDDAAAVVIFFCASCAVREFGPLWLKRANDNDASEG